MDIAEPSADEKIDSDAPSFEQANSESDDPILAKLRKEIEAPR